MSEGCKTLKAYLCPPPTQHKRRNFSNEKQLADDHPIRYANTAGVFNDDEDRHHDICWEVPLSGRGTNFWTPLQLNPEQEDWWHALRDEEDDIVCAGKIRLQRDGSRWMLHIIANYEVEANYSYSTTNDDVTPAGFDVGDSDSFE